MASKLLDTSKLNKLFDFLKRHNFPSDKWIELGQSLDLDDPTLKAIEDSVKSESVNNCLRECLLRWLQVGESVMEKRNYQSLADALERTGEGTIAEEILKEQKIDTCTVLSDTSSLSSSGYEVYQLESVAESADQSGASKFVSGAESVYFDEKTKADDYIDDIVLYIDVSKTLADHHNITLSSFKQMVLNDKVPVTTSLIVCLGLPRSGKSSLLEKIFQKNIIFKDTSKSSFKEYMKRKQDERGLTLHELCILGRRGRNVWSFATKRYGAIFSVLCDIVQQSIKRFDDVSIEIPNEAANLSVLDKLYHWLLSKVKKHLDTIRDEKEEIKLSLLHDGISLVNIMDIGVNKALFDFLPMLLLFCRNHIRYISFSLERDGSNLYRVPDMSSYKERNDYIQVMRRRPRIDYLLRFASIGNMHNCKTIMLAVTNYSDSSIEEPQPSDLTDNNQYTSIPMSSQKCSKLNECKDAILKQAKSQKVDVPLDEWQYVDLNNEKLIEDIKKRIGHFIQDHQMNMPLKWIILRSLMVSLIRKEGEVIILRKKNIEDTAKQLDMDQKEVTKFLTTFTNFGSILYMPSFATLEDIVIVNIWEFTKRLSKLFYPSHDTCREFPDLCKYGFIGKESTKKILGSDGEDLMQVMTALCMTAKIPNGNNVCINGSCGPDEMCYYLPFARVKENYVPQDYESDFAFLEIESINFPANVQACITGNIISSDGVQVVLVLCEENNVTRFDFKYQDHPTVSIEMIYQGSRTRLRVTNNTNDILSSADAVNACSKVLNGCCKCLTSKKEFIPDLTFSVGINCFSSLDVHYLYCNESNDCPKCCQDIPENLFRQCWMKAVLQCSGLTKDDKIRLEKELPLQPHDISQVAENIVQKVDFDQDALANALGITEDEKRSLEGYEKSRSVMSMLMIWERQCEGKATKGLLAKILKELNYEDIVTMLTPPTTDQ